MIIMMNIVKERETETETETEMGLIREQVKGKFNSKQKRKSKE